jgi:hypothetical protein
MSLRDPRTQRIVISAAVSVAVVWGFFVADFLPFGYQRRAHEIGRLRTDYETVAAEVTRLPFFNPPRKTA